MTRGWERRFTVLTKVGMHWFRRTEGYDMFGEETGQISLTDITSVGPKEETMTSTEASQLFDVVDEDGNPSPKSSPKSSSTSSEKVTIYSFKIKTKDGYSRTFRCSREEERERWIEAITMTIAQIQFETEKRANTPPEERALELERKESISNVDFAPVGSPFKKPKFLYHSEMGGSCWGGACAPSPTLISCSGRVVKSFNSNDAPWGEAGAVQVSVGEKDAVSIYLTNGAKCSIDYSRIDEMAALNTSSEGKEYKGIKLEGEKVDVMGYKYSGDPLLVCRVTVAAVRKPKASSSAASGSANGSNSLLTTAATLALQPMALMAASVLSSSSSGFFSPFSSYFPSLSTEQGFVICLLFNAVPFLPYAVTTLFAKKPKAKTFDIFLQSYEESEAYIHSDDLEKPVPGRFIQGTKKDPPGTAEKRWAATMAWRKRENIDTICLEPHPYYNEIKRCYPHFYCGLDLTGKQICYYERPGFLDLKRLTEIGVPTMVRHYTWQNEFCWMYMSTCKEDTRSLSGIDVQNVGLYDLKGVVKEFLAAISKVSGEHYPERAGKIIILNAPGWFSMLWNIIKLGVDPNTQKKVFILSESAAKKRMKELIPHEAVPKEYGGGAAFANDAPTVEKDFPGPLGKEKETARFCSYYEVAMNDYVRRLNSKQKLPLPSEFAWEREDRVMGKEEYLAAYEHGWEPFESQLHLPRDKWDPNGWPGMLFKN